MKILRSIVVKQLITFPMKHTGETILKFLITSTYDDNLNDVFPFYHKILYCFSFLFFFCTFSPDPIDSTNAIQCKYFSCLRSYYFAILLIYHPSAFPCVWAFLSVFYVDLCVKSY